MKLCAHSVKTSEPPQRGDELRPRFVVRNWFFRRAASKPWLPRKAHKCLFCALP
jgi:hypothetical protein